MTNTETSFGLDRLVQNTTDVIDLTINTGDRGHQRHISYLFYPDLDLIEENLETTNQNDDQPYGVIYSNTNPTFIPGRNVEIVYIEAHRNNIREKGLLYPYTYKINVRHTENYQWTLQKRYKDFDKLHKSLLKYVESLTGKSSHSLNRVYSAEKSNSNQENDQLIENRSVRACFPSQNDHFASMNHASIEERCNILKNYLNQVLKHAKLREHISTREFLEVSRLSFIGELGQSFREDSLKKRSKDDFRGRSIFIRVPFICDTCKLHHGQKWFVLKDSYLVYVNQTTGSIGFPMLFDQGLSFNQDFVKTVTNNGIQMQNLQRLMILKFTDEEERDQWFNLLNTAQQESLFTQTQRFNSFAPPREDQFGQWFINGQTYMEAVAKAILLAKEEIFITDWWLSPEVLLVRSTNGHDHSMRLDNLLGKRAEEGIRIYVMIFKDITTFLGLNNEYTRIKLTSKSPTKRNIKVIAHPDHLDLPNTVSSLFFSHHEKTLIIDQEIAFIGGIDLCWGRWDTDQHKIIDIGDENITELKLSEDDEQENIEDSSNIEQPEIKIEQDENKQCQNDQEHPERDYSDKTNTHRKSSMTNPLEKVSKMILKKNNSNQEEINLEKSTGVTVIESALTDYEREMLENENKISAKNKHPNRLKQLVNRKKHVYDDDLSDDDQEIFDTDKIEKLINEQIEKTIDDSDRPTNDSNSDKKNIFHLFPGKDYSNVYEKDFEFIDKYDEDYLDRKVQTRMPWHDQALVVYGQSARDCARHFIQRWNIHKAAKFRFNDFYPYLLPKSSKTMDLSDLTRFKSIIGVDSPLMKIDAQCVRSSSSWSCGINVIEDSIHCAYLNMIADAQHYIYIENQFFISVTSEGAIKNRVADALYSRILRAHNNQEKFRVYIVLPLLPGFKKENYLQMVLYFTMRSINKGESSLYQRLKNNGVSNPEDYISFYGLRNWDILMGQLVTEIVYVHSKLMIIDDKMCICGSANINDRSLLGSRDSEFCLVVNDREMVDSRLNGINCKVGVFCSTWRKTIFRQILGVKNNEINVDDPCSDEFYDYFRKTARENNIIYEEVFNTIPTNRIRKFADVYSYVDKPTLKGTNPKEGLERCKLIRGFIVEFPIDFAADDVIIPKWDASKNIAPTLMWV